MSRGPQSEENLTQPGEPGLVTAALKVAGQGPALTPEAVSHCDDGRAMSAEIARINRIDSRSIRLSA